MICYMPFTHIEEPLFRMLSGAFGAISIYSPAQVLVSEDMRKWAQRDLLKIRHPAGVEGDQLIALVREFKAWAEIHQGGISDMAGFFESRPERFAMMEETNPSQIRHQVRHYGEPPDRETADPIIDAALFLSLAQELDNQQYAMDREMDAVKVLERQMMQQLSGDGVEEARDAEAVAQKTPLSSLDQALSPQLIPQRVRAWSLLALESGHTPWLYITPSRSVIDHILDLFPDGVEIYNQPMVSLENRPMVPPSRMREMVQAMALDPDSEADVAPSDPGEPLPESHLRLIIYRLTDLAPRAFLQTIGGQDTAAERAGRQTNGQALTMIGLVTADAAMVGPQDTL